MTDWEKVSNIYVVIDLYWKTDWKSFALEKLIHNQKLKNWIVFCLEIQEVALSLNIL